MSSKHVLFAMLLGTFAGMASAGGGFYPEPAIPETPGPTWRAEVAVEEVEMKPKSRAEVAAEAAEVARLGLLDFGEGDAPVATPDQERQIALAVRRAVEHRHIAQRDSTSGE